jgi:hypothetical protein
MEYIHYGAKQYEPEKFHRIKNRACFVKPKGGLWGSPIGAKYGWKEWNESSAYVTCDESNSFRFGLKKGAKVAVINTEDKLCLLPDAAMPPILSKLYADLCPASSKLYFAQKFIDFEKMLELGYDAIEVLISECQSLDAHLSGWDCDSVLVLNKDAIETVKKQAQDECDADFATPAELLRENLHNWWD